MQHAQGIRLFTALLFSVPIFAGTALLDISKAHAQSGTLLTSGMGGGASSTARLQAHVTQLQSRLTTIEDCGGTGRMFGGANFTGDKTGECITNFLVNEGDNYARIPTRLSIGSTGAPSQTLDVTGNVTVSGNVDADNMSATSTVSAATVDASGNITAGGNVVAASRVRVGSTGTPSTELDVDGSGDITGGLIVGGHARAGRFGAGVAPAHPLHIAGNSFLNGNAGIGAAPTTDRLHVAGVGTFTDRVNSGIGFYHTSDRSQKDNIQPMADVLPKVRNLQAVTYTMEDSDHRQAGFIAQDVEMVFPEVVSTSDNGILSIDYSKLVAHLAAALQEQDQTMQMQSQRIEQLEAELRDVQEHLLNYK